MQTYLGACTELSVDDITADDTRSGGPGNGDSGHPGSPRQDDAVAG